jgi:hypothetical protein
MTPDAYDRPTCRHCGRTAHRITWPCAVMATVLNGGFALLSVAVGRGSGSRADHSHTEA